MTSPPVNKILPITKRCRISKGLTICTGTQEEPLAEADVEASGSQAPSGPHVTNLRFCRHRGVVRGWGFLSSFLFLSSVHTAVNPWQLVYAPSAATCPASCMAGSAVGSSLFHQWPKGILGRVVSQCAFALKSWRHRYLENHPFLQARSTPTKP